MLNIHLIGRRQFVAAGISAVSFLALPQLAKTETKTTREEISGIVKAWATAYRSISQPEKMIALIAEDIFFEDPTFRLKHTSLPGFRKMIEQTAANLTSVDVDPGLVMIDPPWAALQPTISGMVRGKAGETRKIHVRGATFLMVENGRIKRWTDYYDYRTYTEQLAGV